MIEPYADVAIENPVPMWARLREEAPVFEVPGVPKHFLISRYADIHEVCSRPDIFSNEVHAFTFRDANGRVNIMQSQNEDTSYTRVLGAADGELHRRHRLLLRQAFSVRRIKEFEIWLKARTEALLAHAGESFDMVEHVAAPLPLQAILHLVGLPQEDAAKLADWGKSIMKSLGGLSTAEDIAVIQRDAKALEAYLLAALQNSLERNNDVEGALTLLRDALGRNEIQIWEALGLLIQLVAGGSDTTVGLIAAVTLRLAEKPERISGLRADRTQVFNFIEETLRLDGPGIGNFRRALANYELNGVMIPEGAILKLLWGSANRDERVFEQPEQFNRNRPDLKKHMAFGQGVHSCLGAALARLEATVVLNVLLDQPGGIRIACPLEDLRLEPNLAIRKLKALPIQMGV